MWNKKYYKHKIRLQVTCKTERKEETLKKRNAAITEYRQQNSLKNKLTAKTQMMMKKKTCRY